MIVGGHETQTANFLVMGNSEPQKVYPKVIQSIPNLPRCLYRNLRHVASLIPSIMEAWFNWSLNSASSADSMTSNNPALALEQLEYRIASSRLWN